MEEKVSDKDDLSPKKKETKKIWNPYFDVLNENDEKKTTIREENEQFLQHFPQIYATYGQNSSQIRYEIYVDQREPTPALVFPQQITISPPQINGKTNTSSKFFGFTKALNQNCCAVCGSTFRLTTDLVQHMRFNHQKSQSVPDKIGKFN